MGDVQHKCDVVNHASQYKTDELQKTYTEAKYSAVFYKFAVHSLV